MCTRFKNENAKYLGYTYFYSTFLENQVLLLATGFALKWQKCWHLLDFASSWTMCCTVWLITLCFQWPEVQVVIQNYLNEISKNSSLKSQKRLAPSVAAALLAQERAEDIFNVKDKCLSGSKIQGYIMYLRNFNVTPGDAIFDSSFPVEVCTERKRRDFYERDTICKGGKKDQNK